MPLKIRLIQKQLQEEGYSLGEAYRSAVLIYSGALKREEQPESGQNAEEARRRRSRRRVLRWRPLKWRD